MSEVLREYAREVSAAQIPALGHSNAGRNKTTERAAHE
jgi:hypothetical protein